MLKKLVKAAIVGAGVYAIGKAGEGIGYVKGVIATIKYARKSPEWVIECDDCIADIEQNIAEIKVVLKNKKA